MTTTSVHTPEEDREWRAQLDNLADTAELMANNDLARELGYRDYRHYRTEAYQAELERQAKDPEELARLIERRHHPQHKAEVTPEVIPEVTPEVIVATDTGSTFDGRHLRTKDGSVILAAVGANVGHVTAIR